MEMINGFACKTCTDVEYAKKHIDPAHPKDGPYRENRIDAPERRADAFGGAIRLDGQLKGVQPTSDAMPDPLGRVVDLRA